MEDDLWMDVMPEGDDIGLLFEDGMLAAFAPAGAVVGDIGGGYYGTLTWEEYEKRRKRQIEAERLRLLEQNRIALGVERNYRKDVVLVRDRNLAKAQAVQAIPRRREEEIQAKRMDNLKKAQRVQRGGKL